MAIPPKASGRQRSNTAELATVTSIVDRTVEVPEPSQSWRASTVEQWDAAWRSELGTYWLSATDLPAIRRLFDLRDRLETVEITLDVDGLVTSGSMGQVVVHPLVKIGDSLRTEIRNLEDRIGLSPMARLRLGVKVGEAAKSLDAMNDRLRRGIEDDSDLPAGVDPRTVIDLPGS